MKDTLDFYSNIYKKLFKKKYTKNTNRAKPALRKFQKYIDDNNIKINKMVDIGCAWGYTLEYWKSKGVKSTGVDVSKEIVRKNRNRGFPCHFASATDLSIFKDKKFDLYMATDVYEHLREKDLLDAIEEAKRITKKYLLIRPHPRLDKRGKSNIKKALHLTVWPRSIWQKFFEENGLKMISIGENGKISYKNVFLMEIDDD
jgi:predicted TPR repeat methyltransferase